MEKTVQEPIISKTKQNEYKLKEFREYISQKDVVLAIVKFLLSIKNSKESIENPLKALNDYFGSYRDPSWDDFEILKVQIQKIQAENSQLEDTIEQYKQKIEQVKEAKIKAEEEQEKLRIEEESKKQSKKPGKK